MKNRTLLFFLIFLTTGYVNLFAENFIFEATEINISKNGDIINAKNGTATSKIDNIIIEAEKFEYNKKKLILNATNGVSKLLNKNLKIEANNFLYNQNLFELNASGNVIIKDDKNKLLIESENISYNTINGNLESKTPSIIKDNEGNIFSTNEFFYYSKDQYIKFNDTKLTDNEKNTFQIQDAYFNLNTNQILGKDFYSEFNNNSFNEANEPRLKGLTLLKNKDKSIISKGIFTTCKKNDSCPPWQISAKKITHDNKKKVIYYENAWLKLYDKPIFYFPKFFHPDPSVKRQSGFLMPSLTSSANLGSSFNLPYYHVISDDKDLTIKPRLYSNQKALIQTEFRGVKAKSEYSLDFGNTINDEKSNKGHIFAKYKGEIDLLNFETTELNINIQQTSDDTYLKAYKVNSPIIDNTNLLNSSLEIDAYREDLSFNANLSVIEDLSKKNSDRYEFVYPSYIISKQLNNINFLNGDSVLNSSGYMKNYNTNIFEKVIVNDFLFNSEFKINENGFKNNYNFLIKNVNTDAKNSLKYKTKQNYELASIFEYNLSYPLKKSNKNNYNLLNPLASIKFSPNNNKDLRNDSRRIDINNIFSLNRLGQQDTVEGGTSLTYGIEYSKNSLLDIEIFKSSIASVVRYDKDDNLPKESKLGNKNSDIVGGLSYIPNHILKLNYDFSLDNNFTDTNYQILGADIKINNFVTSFEYLNDNNSVNEESFYTSKSALIIDDAQEVIFETRQNKKTKATEFYNIIYQYRNDCLIAALEYNKDYYNDGDLKPEENIFFKLTIVPFGQTSTPNLIK